MTRWSRRGEKGFTLVELLVAIPIIGLLGVAMGAVLIQLLHSDRISGGMLAVRQVQNAGDRVSQDGVQAQTVTFGDNMTSGDWSLQLKWNGGWMDLDTGDFNYRSVTVTYTLVPDNGSYSLQRHEVALIKSGTETTNRDLTSTVARHLDPSRMYCRWDASEYGTFSFRVVSVVGTKTEERVYSIAPRPG